MVILTDKAIKKVRSIAEQQKLDGHVLRLMVVGGGCSGFSYDMDFEEAPEPEDGDVAPPEELMSGLLRLDAEAASG